MTTTPDTDIRELRERITSRFDQIEQKVNKLTENVNALKMNVVKIEARLEEWKPSIYKISNLAEKVGELKNWRQIALIVISATVAATMGWFLHSGKP